MRSGLSLWWILGVLALAACGRSGNETAATTPAATTLAVGDATLTNPPAADWPAGGRGFDQQRFSPLDQVDTTNVQRLGLAWSLDIDAWNVSTVPVAWNGVLYFAVGYTLVHAVDGATGKLLWKHDAQVRGPKMRMAWGIRGLALWDDKVLVGTQDGRLLALSAKDGTKVWEVQTTEGEDFRYITGAPLVFDGKVLIGHGGADFGKTRGYVTAYDARDGKPLWRFHTVPGDPSKGFENDAMAMAAKTWTGEWWKHGGGGTVWNAMTYDPEFDRVYLGVGNGSPWNQSIRSPGGGDNLFLCSIVALDAKTGAYAWHFQETPGETWDFNASQDMVLATLPIDGKPRKLLLQAPKNGFFYAIDRETGKFVSAAAFAKVTWAKGVDPATGRPIEEPSARYGLGETLIWPGPMGAHTWPPMAYSPDTHLAYVPGRDLPGHYDAKGIDPKRWDATKQGGMGVNPANRDMPTNAGQSWLVAWDPVQQKEAWRALTPGASPGGTLATHGGLVFQPDADGKFVAFDAKSGTRLWSFDMGVGSQSAPVTYGIGGKQYVSVLAGFAGQPLLLGSMSAQHGWAGREHPKRLLTFALDAKTPLPPTPPPAQVQPIDDPALAIDAARAATGEMLFVNCVMCHGLAAIGSGAAPDLRASAVTLSADAFRAVVRDGTLEARGMPRFQELSDDELESMRLYVRRQARAALGAASSR
ncbi:MAG TPA: PQQ-dependent dehydrogenase, methanol/ethanol family [Nevskiaceae bacterium]|nr:PQQ-dependent dehydrogenase, methanol/ethanol family [Nevskiaceae bacterium]